MPTVTRRSTAYAAKRRTQEAMVTPLIRPDPAETSLAVELDADGSQGPGGSPIIDIKSLGTKTSICHPWSD